MLNRAGVAAGRGARQLAALEQLDPGAGLGEERGRRAADDPAADDRDIWERIPARPAEPAAWARRTASQPAEPAA
jgi:hypothetical protein